MNTELDLDYWDLDIPAKPITPPSTTLFMKALNALPKTKLIYRIENENGDGPYQQGFTGLWQLEPHSPASGRPTPNLDEGFKTVMLQTMPTFFSDHYKLGAWFDWFNRSLRSQGIDKNVTVRFAFSSREQLLKWFSNGEELIRLHKNGFRVVVRKIEGFDSGTQVIYLE